LSNLHNIYNLYQWYLLAFFQIFYYKNISTTRYQKILQIFLGKNIFWKKSWRHFAISQKQCTFFSHVQGS